LKSEIAELRAIVQQLQQNFNSCNACSQQSTSVNQQSINKTSISLSSASLEQNIPNPFNNTTIINYTLPQTYSFAKIIVVDKAGKVLKEVTLSEKGKGSLQLGASTLASGAYQYSLYVNGKLVDTKQMLISK
jgi:hypothetical protein